MVLTDVAELVDALDLGSSRISCGGSSPFIRKGSFIQSLSLDARGWKLKTKTETKR